MDARTVRPNAPSAESINQVMIGRQLAGQHAIASVEYAMELGRWRRLLPRRRARTALRDIQAARYHPLQSGPQAEYAGAALGLPIDRIY